MGTTVKSLIERVKGNTIKLHGVEYRGFDILPENQKIILEYDNELNANNYKDETRVHYLRTLARLSIFVNKPFKEMTKKDIADFFVICKEKKYGPEALEYHRIGIKRFFKWLLGEDEIYPENVRWLKKSNGLKKQTLPEELLTKEDVLRIVEASGNPRDRALLMTLYESSARRGEIVSCRIKHLKFDDGYATLLFPLRSVSRTGTAKTGSYEAVLFDSVPYLHVWLNHHPDRDNPDAPLFTNIGNRAFGTPLEVDGVYIAIRKAAKRAGLKKRIYPHLFRKSISTEWAKSGFTAEEINLRSGRAQGSREAQVYIRLSGGDVKKHILRKKGIIEDEEKDKKNILEPIKCWRCHTENPATHKFCGLCGAVLEEKTARKIVKIKIEHRESDKIMDRLIMDKEFRDFVDKKLKEHGIVKS